MLIYCSKLITTNNKMMIQIKEKTQEEQEYITLIRSVNTLRGRLNMCGGGVLVVVGIVTLPIPMGSIQMIGIGTMLITNPKLTMKQIIRKMYWGVVTKYKTMRWRR